MKPVIYNPANVPPATTILRKKRAPSKNKGHPGKKTWREMIELRNIFRNRINPTLGLTTDETISRFHKLTPERVLSLSRDNRSKKWNKIKKLISWLKKENDMAIIFDNLKAQTRLIHPYNEYDPLNEKRERVLTRYANVYFRCIKIDDASKYQKLINQIMNGLGEVSDKTDRIVMDEEEKNKAGGEKEAIEKISKPQILVQKLSKK